MSDRGGKLWTGYEGVLTDATCSGWNTQMDLVVYYQLAVETFERTAHQLVKQHEYNKSGYRAWNTLCDL